MNGVIKITAKENNLQETTKLQVQINLTEVDTVDKIQLIGALVHSLNMDFCEMCGAFFTLIVENRKDEDKDEDWRQRAEELQRLQTSVEAIQSQRL